MQAGEDREIGAILLGHARGGVRDPLRNARGDRVEIDADGMF